MKARHYSKFTAAAATLLLLAGCSHFNPDNGATVAHNAEQQVVDPYAGFDEDVAALDGQKAEKLLDDYRREKAAAPRERLLQGIGD